jgi:hypothetical protein
MAKPNNSKFDKKFDKSLPLNVNAQTALDPHQKCPTSPSYYNSNNFSDAALPHKTDVNDVS